MGRAYGVPKRIAERTRIAPGLTIRDPKFDSPTAFGHFGRSMELADTDNDGEFFQGEYYDEDQMAFDPPGRSFD